MLGKNANWISGAVCGKDTNGVLVTQKERRSPRLSPVGPDCRSIHLVCGHTHGMVGGKIDTRTRWRQANPWPACLEEARYHALQRRATCPVLALLFVLFCPTLVEGQWLSTWIEIEPTLPSASLRPGNLSLCDGSNASLSVSVRGGAGPWRVELLRDGKTFALITLESRCYPVSALPHMHAASQQHACHRSITSSSCCIAQA